MKFRRNIKEEKIFRTVAILGALFFVALLIYYLITFNEVLLRFLIPLLFISPLSFFVSNSLKTSYIEFQKDTITFINGNGRNIEISISHVETILIPSLSARKKDNPIIFKGQDINNPVSYSPEIENYIKENIEVTIVYYDNFNQAIK